MNIKRKILIRSYLVIIGVLLFGATIIGQVLRIYATQGDQYEPSVLFKDETLYGKRGDICSDDGQPLVTTVPVYTLYQDITVLKEKIFIDSLDTMCNCLKEHLGKSKSHWTSKLKEARRDTNRYVFLANNISHRKLEQIKKCPILKWGRNKGGRIIEEKKERVHLLDPLAKTTLGKVKDNKARKGIEFSFNKELKGGELDVTLRRHTRGVYLPIEEFQEPEPGRNVHTNINVIFQEILHEELRQGLKSNKAARGTAILMGVNDGKIKGIVNLGVRTSDSTYIEQNENYAVTRARELGSILKVPLLTTLIENGRVNLENYVDIEGGRRKFSDRTIVDVYPNAEDRDITILQCLKQSSNVGFAKLAIQNYTDVDDYLEDLRKFDLLSPTGIDLVGEVKPGVTGIFSKVSLPFMSMGYEITYTPLQVLNFYNSIANDGVMNKPYLVSGIEENGKLIQRFRPQVVKRICSEQTAKQVQIALEAVVEDGTAKKAKSEYLKIAGKTGTAQVADGGGYGNAHIASFVGYFPAENPIYSCIVVVEEPSAGPIYGGAVAAPIFKKIAEKVYGYSDENIEPVNAKERNLDITKLPLMKNGNQKDMAVIYNEMDVPFINCQITNWVKTNNTQDTLILNSLKEEIFNTDVIPDVRGMGLRDALYILENRGLKVKFTGKGTVKKQLPKPGKDFEINDVITIDLG